MQQAILSPLVALFIPDNHASTQPLHCVTLSFCPGMDNDKIKYPTRGFNTRKKGLPLDEYPSPPPDWDRCHAFLPGKGKFCRAQSLSPAGDGSKPIYCGNHAHLYVGRSGSRPSGAKERIPCPLDPSHTIFKNRLAKHLKCCPARRRKDSEQSMPFYRQNVNCGGDGALSLSSSVERPTKKRRECMPCRANDEWACGVALRVLDLFEKTFLKHDSSATEDMSNERRAHLSSLSLVNMIEAIPTMDMSDAEFESGLGEVIASNKIKSGGAKHLRQIGSIVGHLRGHVLPPLGAAAEADSSLLSPDVSTVLELGSGRGMTGLMVAGALSAHANDTRVKLFMVEKAGTRGKADTTIRRAIENSRAGKEEYARFDFGFERIRCDLAHVYLPAALELDKILSDGKEQNICVVAKHLCGAGTDLALKSLESIRSEITTSIFATCCHGLCDFDSYVGRKFLLEQGRLGRDEFELMRKWSMASAMSETQDKAVSDGKDLDKKISTKRLDEEGEEHNQDESQYQLNDPSSIIAVVKKLGLACGCRGLGRACQRLIDQGRADYCREKLGAHTDIFHYVGDDITPQNAAIFIHGRQSDG